MDGGGLALLGPDERLLRAHPPTLPMELHGRQAEPLAKPSRDQLARRRPRLVHKPNGRPS